MRTLVRAPIDPAALVRAVSNPAQRRGPPLPRRGAPGERRARRHRHRLRGLRGDGAARAARRSSTRRAERFGTADVAVEHRLGELRASRRSASAIAVGHAHRDAAYALSRWVIEELKRRVPIWKREHYADGTREWVDPTGHASVGRRRHDRAPRPVRAHDRVSAHLGHRSLQLPLQLLHAARGAALAARSRTSSATRRSREVVRQLAPLGLRRVRITGGEPTIRPQLATLVRMLRDVPAVEDIALSTNGVRLPELARELADAGLDRVNMSSDSLRPDRIAAIARRDLALRSRRRGDGGAGRRARADQAERRRDARHQRRRGARLRATDARAPVARALHRADAGRRDGDALRGPRRAERRGAARIAAAFGPLERRRRSGARQRAGGVSPRSPARRARSA